MGSMKQKRHKKTAEHAVDWLPIDSRLVLPLFSFGHIHGAAKVFLTIEMTLAVGVVLGSLGMAILHLVG